MNLFTLVLFVCFFVFLFCLYLLCRDDFVFLRKDVSTEKVFNVAIAVILFSILLSRILYVVINPSPNFLNPLVFLLFPYFPGLTLTGGVVGGALVSFFLYKKHKIPAGRMFDFLSFSLLAAFPIGFLGFILSAEGRANYIVFTSLGIVYGALFVVFLKFLLPLLLKGKLREGTVGLIFLISFSAISLVENFIGSLGRAFYFTIEDFILIFVLIVSLVFLIKQEGVLTRVKKYWEAKKT